jgi:hypothetical protein
MRLDDYRDLGGHMESVRPVESVIDRSRRLEASLAPRERGEGRGEGGSQTGHDA